MVKIFEDESDTDKSEDISESDIGEGILEMDHDINQELEYALLPPMVENVDSDLDSDDDSSLHTKNEGGIDSENSSDNAVNLGDCESEINDYSETTNEGGKHSENSSDEESQPKQEFHYSDRPKRNIKSTVKWKD